MKVYRTKFLEMVITNFLNQSRVLKDSKCLVIEKKNGFFFLAVYTGVFISLTFRKRPIYPCSLKAEHNIYFLCVHKTYILTVSKNVG
jgi:hypothetical protein